MTIECDVLVVGAGPAGSSAAMAAAQGGLKTIFIDKKKEVGVPIQCAETISKILIPLLPFNLPKKLIENETTGVSFWTEGVTVDKRGDYWSAYGINRAALDKWVAEKAVSKGATLSTNTELIDLEVEENFNVKKAIIQKNQIKKEIIPKVVVAADGVDSRVLDVLGVKVDKEHIGKILSYELTNVTLSDSKMDQLFLGDFAPGAYGYIFPKSRTNANVGVATLSSQERLKAHYEDFLNIPAVKNQLKNAIIVNEKSGKAPFKYMTEKWVYGNVVLVGDAAVQNIKPFGEGIVPAIACGSIAGKTCADYIKFGKPLGNYTEEVNKKFGSMLKLSDKITELMHELGKTPSKKNNLLRLGLFSKIININDIEKLLDKDDEYIKNKLSDIT